MHFALFSCKKYKEKYYKLDPRNGEDLLGGLLILIKQRHQKTSKIMFFCFYGCADFLIGSYKIMLFACFFGKLRVKIMKIQCHELLQLYYENHVFHTFKEAEKDPEPQSIYTKFDVFSH